MAESEQIVIKGVTREGRKFRPSDWAQRLTTAVAAQTPGRRMRFHPGVRMTTEDGINCVVIDSRLEQDDPMTFEFLTGFAQENNLEVERREAPEKVN